MRGRAGSPSEAILMLLKNLELDCRHGGAYRRRRATLLPARRPRPRLLAHHRHRRAEPLRAAAGHPARARVRGRRDLRAQRPGAHRRRRLRHRRGAAGGAVARRGHPVGGRGVPRRLRAAGRATRDPAERRGARRGRGARAGRMPRGGRMPGPGHPRRPTAPRHPGPRDRRLATATRRGARTTLTRRGAHVPRAHVAQSARVPRHGVPARLGREHARRRSLGVRGGRRRRPASSGSSASPTARGCSAACSRARGRGACSTA